MKILLSGLTGHMGKEVEKLSLSGAFEIAAGVDANNDGSSKAKCYPDFEGITEKFDVILDFSHHSVTGKLVSYALSVDKPLVMATTGQTEEEFAVIKAASGKIPVFYAANYSMGIAVLIDIAKRAAAALSGADIEIVETHHNRKIDAPSGTALSIADGIREVRPELRNNCGRSGIAKREKDEIGISSIRMGNIAGIHEVIIGTQNETLTIKHEAANRGVFADGAIRACGFIIGKSAGLYGMKDIIGD